jgi:hypothetical protein
MCEAEFADYASLLSETVQCKQAAIVIGFFTYLLHQGATAAAHYLEYKKADEKKVRALRAFKLDIEQRSFFYLVFVLFCTSLTPVPFGIVMIYLYFFLTYPLVFAGFYAPERWGKLRIAGTALQVAIVFTLMLFVLINPWCRQLFFRYVIASP